jgi:BlaI family transcriptional regulator, penicillinase repressor
MPRDRGGDVQVKRWSSFLLPSQREIAILEYLWLHGTASSRDIHEVFGHLWQIRRQVIHGMLQVMLEKGLLERHIEQSRMVYKPASNRADFEQVVIQQVAETFFRGSLYALWHSVIRHPQFQLVLERASASVTVNKVRPTN